MAVPGICLCDQSLKLHEKEKAALEMKIQVGIKQMYVQNYSEKAQK